MIKRNSTLSFRVSAGLKNIIGRDLISDKYIAIFELVKNSYDAGASKVDKIFTHTESTDRDSARAGLVLNSLLFDLNAAFKCV